MYNIYVSYSNNRNYIYLCYKATHDHARPPENTGSTYTTSFDTLCRGKLEKFHFLDENNHKYKIFSILSSARWWTSAILGGKHDSRPAAILLSVLASETSYQKLAILLCCNQERA